MKCGDCQQIELLSEINEKLGIIVFRGSKPKAITFFITEQNGMSFKFAIDVESHPKDLAVIATVTVIIPGKPAVSASGAVAVDPDGGHVAVVTDEWFVGELDDRVEIAASLADAAGNASQPTSTTAVIKDTIAPGAPQLTLRVTEQI